MKNIVSGFILLAVLNSSVALAECQWGRDIKKVDGGYLYTTECHIQVGQLVEENKLLFQQNESLKKVISLQDLALSKTEEKARLWMDTSLKTQEELSKYERTREMDLWVRFGIGVGVTVLSVWASGQLR